MSRTYSRRSSGRQSVPAGSKTPKKPSPSREPKPAQAAQPPMRSASGPTSFEQELAERAAELERTNVELTQEIEQRQIVEEQLREAEQKADDLVRYAPTAIYEIDLHGARFTRVNDTMCAMTGYTREELIAMSPFDLLDEDSQREFRLRMKRTLAGEPVDESVEYKVKVKDGRDMYAILKTRFLYKGGKPVTAFVIAHDITERRKAEEALKTQRQLLDTVINHMPAAVNLIRGSDLTLQLINPAYQSIAPGKEMFGKTLDELWPETGRNFAEICRKVLATGEPYHAQDELNMIRRRPDGPLEPAYFSWSLHRVRLPGDEGWGILNTSWETTRRKQIELALKEIAEKYSSLFNATSDGIWIHNLDGVILEANDAYCRMSGYSRDELVGMPISTLEAVESPRDIAQHIRKLLEAGGHDRFESRHRHKDGSLFDVDITALYLEREGGRIAIFSRDISVRKQAEQAVRESESRFKSLFESLPDMTLVFQRLSNGFVLMAHNQAAVGFTRGGISNLVGKTAQEIYASRPDLLGRVERAFAEQTILRYAAPYRMLTTGEDKYLTITFAYVPPDRVMVHIQDITEAKRMELDLQRRTAELQALMEAVPTAVFISRDPDSRTITGNRAARELVELPSNANISKSAPEDERPTGWQEMRHGVPIPPEDLPMQQATHGKEVRDYEMDLVFRDGTVKSVVSSAAPLRDEQGNPQGGIAVLTDITARIRAEEERESLRQDLERRAIELQATNKELEAFTYSVSHDLRGPLNLIEQHSQLLLDEYGAQLPDHGRHLIQLIRDNSTAMNWLAEQVLTLARMNQQSLNRLVVCTTDLVREALQELKDAQAGRTVDISIGDLPPASADPLLLKQVWLNLISNALKFTRPCPVAHIEIGSFEELGRTVYFVKDNGVGFNMAQSDRLFRAFQRLHHPEDFEGSGLGLAIVERIIRRHGGRVWAQGQVDQGATFNFTLG